MIDTRFPTAGLRVFLLVLLLTATVQAQSSLGPNATFLTPEQRLENGLQDYRGGRHAEADRALTKWLTEFKATGQPFDSITGADKVYYVLAMARFQQDKWTESIPVIQEFLERFPRGFDREELSYLLGVVHFYLKKDDEAFKLLGDFARTYPKSSFHDPALLLMAVTLLRQEKHKENAEFLAPLIGKVEPGINSEMQLLRLYSLMQSEQREEALRAVAAFDSEDPRNLRLAYFHLLTLRLGDDLFRQKEWRKALYALQRVWPRERVVARQSERIARLEAYLEREKFNAVMKTVEGRRLRELATQARAELVEFEKVADYDTALQLRIAQAFTALELNHEAALVYRRMMARLPESELLEKAALELLHCLARMESWPELIVESEGFEQRFPKSAFVPQALYLRGEAAMRLGLFERAAEAFLAVAARYPEHGMAEQSHFQAGYSLLSADQNEEGLKVLAEHAAKFPEAKLTEDVLYWRGMGNQFARDYEQSREFFTQYLEQYPEGKYRADAEYRMVFALYAQKQFAEAAAEAQKWLEAHPDEPLRDEALNLLGDSFFATSRIDEGLAAYRQVSRTTDRYYDYAAFRIGKALAAREEWDALRAHFEGFMKERPESNRLAEAIAELAKIESQQGAPEKAREIYWAAIEKHGDDPEAAAVEMLFENLAKQYRRAGETEEFQQRLTTLAVDAGLKKPTLRARALWMQSKLMPRDEPDAAARLVEKYAAVVKPTLLSPILLADGADALRALGDLKKARELYRTILRWYPRSLLKERAYAGLGLVAQAQGETDEALEQFDKFERTGLDVTLREPVLRARAEIYKARGDTAAAVAQLERVLELPQVKGAKAAETLYAIGHAYYEAGDYKKAIAFLQRIYILYGRWSELVAKAYWESGQAFEKLGQTAEARSTYAELVANETLAGTPEFKLAEARLRELPAPKTSDAG